MTRWVAFLRGINLGKRRVKMDRLRGCFEDLDVENVDTFIASGNVIFDHEGSSAAGLEERIERHLAGALGFEVDTFVRPMARLEELLQGDAVRSAERDGFTPYVTFLKGESGRATADALGALETPDDRFLTTGDAAFWFRRGRLTDSDVSTADLEKALGGGTRRKLNTVRRIVDRYADAGGAG